MTRYFVHRLLAGATVMACLLTLTFLAAYVIGDPVELMLNREYSTNFEAERDALRASSGLDRPVWVQFADYMGDAVRGDLGTSLWQNRPATEVVIERLPASGLLVLSAVAVALIVAVPLALLGARFAGHWLDTSLTAVATLLASLPSFWLALAMIYLFAVALPLLPTSGYGAPQQVILPVLTLAALPAGHTMQVLQAAMAAEYRQQYVMVARAKGLRERHVAIRHVLRNATVVLITQAGLLLVVLIDGAVLVETVFAWPGIGQLSLEAVQRRDLPVLMAAVILVGAFVTAVNLVVDVAYALLDPRVRLVA